MVNYLFKVYAKEMVPQVADNESPQSMDAARQYFVYDKVINRITLVDCLSEVILTKEDLYRTQFAKTLETTKPRHYP